ncbi:MAG: SDR family oxidoreductase [Anaerolineae bacterium]|nr:SDR family oxidoreductase [Anaerolineae bacterium]
MGTFDTSDVDLSGQIAIVTGGGRGLGRAMALALAAAQAKVAVVARNQAELAQTVDLIRQAGGHGLGLQADVTDPQAVAAMVDAVEAQLGPVDILVNSAGVPGVPSPIWTANLDEWRRALDVNVYGVVACTVSVMRRMVERHRGRIINIASGAALAPIPNGSAYCVSKAALARLTECVAVDGREHSVVAFAINPGSVRTAMTDYLIESEAGRTYLPWYREFILGGGDVPAELSANLVVLLASGRADSLSGRFIEVTDDLDQLIAQAEQIVRDDLHTLRLRKV